MACTTIDLRSTASRETTAARATAPTAASRGRLPGALVQVAVLLGAVVVYFGVRGFTESGRAQALANADAVIALERSLGLDWEPALQRLADDSPALLTVMNWIYIWGHWPVIAAVMVWLLLRRRPAYRVVRNALLLSGGIGMVVFVLFPVAPPRLTTAMGMVDTITQTSSSYRVLQPPAFVNQYAAVPSLHFGWDLLIGLALVTQARSRLVRIVGALMPVAMLAAIVLTANHYVVDAVAGGVVALTGLAIARWWVERSESAVAMPARAVVVPRQRHPASY